MWAKANAVVYPLQSLNKRENNYKILLFSWLKKGNGRGNSQQLLMTLPE